jgi:hypothetical protein
MSPVSAGSLWLVGTNGLPFGAFLTGFLSGQQFVLARVLGLLSLVGSIVYVHSVAGIGPGANLADQALRLRRAGFSVEEATRLLTSAFHAAA